MENKEVERAHEILAKYKSGLDVRVKNRSLIGRIWMTMVYDDDAYSMVWFRGGEVEVYPVKDLDPIT
jgi:hypothetical protein